MENKKLITFLVLIILVLLVCVGAMFSMQASKEKSNLAIGDKKISAGDSLVVALTDDHGNPIANETINIKLTDKDGKSIDEKIKTNSKGKAKFTVEEKGTYSVECKFDGNNLYASSSLSDEIKVEKATTEVIGEKQSSTSTDSFDGNVYSSYSSSIGSYRVVDRQQELAVLETPDGNYYVMGGDGIYTYAGRDSSGAIQLGSPVG